MPFAGKYTLAGKLVELNKWRGNPDMEQVVKELPKLLMKKQINSEMIILDREDEVHILDRGITSNFTPIKTSEREKYIKEVLSKNRFSYDYDEEINHRNKVELFAGKETSDGKYLIFIIG